LKNQGGSQYRQELVVVRHDSPDWRGACTKLVRPDFTQAIDTYWRKRTPELNLIFDSFGIPE
jgi:hypothetical protein